MTASKMVHEAERWLETAGEDLRAARTLRESQLFAQACFMAQQCGEKSIKAMWYALGQEPEGMSIQKLIIQFPDPHSIPDVNLWRQHAAVLDKFFSSTRYPNELPDLTPGQNYFLRDADLAIDYANLFLRSARDWLRLPQPTPPVAVLEPVVRPPAPVSPLPDSVDARLELSSPAVRATPPPVLAATATIDSSGEHQHHRRRRDRSTFSRLKKFVTQREMLVLAVVLIIIAIVIGVIIPYGIPIKLR